jgi:hypothetical protein
MPNFSLYKVTNLRSKKVVATGILEECDAYQNVQFSDPTYNAEGTFFHAENVEYFGHTAFEYNGEYRHIPTELYETESMDISISYEELAYLLRSYQL